MRFLLSVVFLFCIAIHPAVAITNFCDQHIGSASCPDKGGVVTMVDGTNVAQTVNHGCTDSGFPNYLGCIDNFKDQTVCCGPYQNPNNGPVPCTAIDTYGECAKEGFCPLGTTPNAQGTCAEPGNVCCVHAADAFQARSDAVGCALMKGYLGCLTQEECKAGEGYPSNDGICDQSPEAPPVVCCLNFNQQTAVTPIGPGQTITQPQDPLKGLTVQTAIGRAIQLILGVAGSLGLLAFVYGGFLWITAFGNPDNIKKGKETIVWAAIGIIFIFAAYTLLSYLQSFFTSTL